MRTSRCLGCAILFVVGCGGSNPGAPDAAIDAPPADARTAVAADYEGLWLMESMTLSTDTGPVTIDRDGLPQSLRGDTVFAPVDDHHGTLDVRQVLLSQGLMAGELQQVHNDVLVEPHGWVVTKATGEATVFHTDLVGDRLVLTLDPTDPRNTAPSPPLSVVVERVTPWTGAVVGTWNVVTLQLPSGTVALDTCINVTPDTTWAIVHMTAVFDARLLFQRTMTTTAYSDENCTVQTGQSTSVQSGFAEEEGTALRLWGRDTTENVFQAFTLDVSANQGTLTRTSCLPLPDCESTAPIAITVQRVQ